MSVALIKRSSLLRNLIVFVSFALFFTFVSLSLFEQKSILDKEFFLEFFKTHILLFVFYVATVLSIWQAQRHSILFLAAFLLSVFGITFPLFIYSFEKDILILNFIFLITGFYFWIFWRLELSEASYCPRFEVNQLNIRPEQKFLVNIVQDGGKSYKALLTNWDETSCFLLLEESWEELRGHVALELNFEGLVFRAKGHIVSHYGPGLGLRLERTEKSGALNWIEFYDIINDRGYI